MYIRHTVMKLRSTLGIIATLFMARTFGKYQHSAYDGFGYAIYHWRGRDWAIPTGPIEYDEELCCKNDWGSIGEPS